LNTITTTNSLSSLKVKVLKNSKNSLPNTYGFQCGGTGKGIKSKVGGELEFSPSIVHILV
jgi:hypothetical protein